MDLVFEIPSQKEKEKKIRIDFDFLNHAMINGSSEMVSSLSSGITTFLFNTVLLNSVGEIGVSSISIILYVNFLLSSIFIFYYIL